VTGHKHSHHHSYKTLEVKMNEEEKLKDSRIAEMDTKMVELNNRIHELEQVCKEKEEEL